IPSIRHFSTMHEVSRFTSVQAYDRLVAAGYLESRPGSGFYVTPRSTKFGRAEPTVKLDRAMDVLWLLRNALNQPNLEAIPGAGWLPHDWMDTTGIQRSLRKLAQKPGRYLTEYGTPQGYPPLRQQLQQRLAGHQILTSADQILLTTGATHALDLIARYYIRPGDAVLVDDPGYFILYGTLKSYGAKIIGVPWNIDGPDTDRLEQLMKTHKPKLFFTNSILHNPTGASISQAVAYRLLRLAEDNDIVIIEDDVFGDFHPGQTTRLATLDQLKRVIYLGSFSKTISASMRVGFIAGCPDVVKQLTDLKLLSGITTSEINERMIHQMLANGQYRKRLNGLHKRLQQCREQALDNFEKMQLTSYIEPEGGMFIWIKMPEHIDIVAMSNLAATRGIMLAPGNLFRPHQEPTQWMRFNVASCNETKHLAFIKKTVADV
ncbi:MAG TPA: PLP-dependent aminotransferase family protein, partial [Gammaproteobacteria bacterium]|nr:PLP-dependent aminotransferase family protein [Gammaproteobacteria bacterium]